MDIDDRELLADLIDQHLRGLRHADSQATAVAWMKTAYQLLEKAADDMRRPRIYAVPSAFGVPTFTLDPPRAIALPMPGFQNPPRGFFDPKTPTVVFGDRYSNNRAWTRADTRRLERKSAKK